LSACELPVDVANLFRNKNGPADNKNANVEKRAVEDGTDSEYLEDENEQRTNTKQAILTNLRLRYPLMEYGVTNLVHHLRFALDPGQESNEDIAAKLDDLFKPGTVAFTLYLLRHWDSNAFTNVTALHVATTMQLASYVMHLVSSGANVDALDNSGRTALHHICRRCGDETEVATDITKALLDAHAQPDIPDRDGMKPLHYAVYQNAPKIVRLLLDAGVSPLTPRTKNDPYWTDLTGRETKGETPLFYSTEGPTDENRTQIMKMFLPRISQDRKSLYKMLAWTVTTTNNETVQDILKLGKGRLDVNVLVNGIPLLYVAVYKQNLQLARMLLQNCADPNAHCKSEGRYHRDLNQVLHQEHIDIETATEPGVGLTPLHGWAGVDDRARDHAERDYGDV
jgi:ankyrin repeat protein